MKNISQRIIKIDFYVLIKRRNGEKKMLFNFKVNLFLFLFNLVKKNETRKSKVIDLIILFQKCISEAINLI